jgi:hypothetical protein
MNWTLLCCDIHLMSTNDDRDIGTSTQSEHRSIIFGPFFEFAMSAEWMMMLGDG